MGEKEFIKNIRIENILFYSEENNYAIFLGDLNGKQFTFKGPVSDPCIGDTLDGEGIFKQDDRGQFYQMSFFLTHIPSQDAELIAYIANLKIPGIGKKSCEKIVKAYGISLFDIIETGTPEDVMVQGVAVGKISKLFEALKETVNLRSLHLFVLTLGLGMKLTSKVIDFYGDGVVDKIKMNPYRLMFDIEGIGFEKADAIGLRLGITPNSKFRIRAMIFHKLRDLGDKTGSTRFVLNDFFQDCSKALSIVTRDELVDVFWDLYEDSKICLYQINGIQFISTSKDFYNEKGVAKHVWRLMDDLSAVRRNVSLDRYIEEIAESGNVMELTKSQSCGIKGIINSNFSLLIGPPGRGKTFTVKALIDILNRFGHVDKAKVGLAAPTGIASKMLEQSAKMPAVTIHRLLKFLPETGEFEFNETNRMEDLDFLAIDEGSMLDVAMGHFLLKAISNKTQVVILGDKNQLQSVERGAVLRDLMTYGDLPVFELVEGKRFSENSGIGVVSEDIRKGLSPSVVNKPDCGFYFKRASTPGEIIKNILYYITKCQRQFECSIDDIQILTPKVIGSLGSVNLSQVIKNFVNPSENSPSVFLGDICLSIGDRVVLTQNLHKKGVYNGDIGYVQFVNRDRKSIHVEFDTDLVEFKGMELKLLSLAYALSVHKSQGSQFKIVIMPFHSQLSFMMHRSMVYTAITRSREAFIGIGDFGVLANSAEYDVSEDRVTTLGQHLYGEILRVDKKATLDISASSTRMS